MNKRYKKVILILLIILNVMVLMGQLWPEGAPPFANAVNLIFLFSSLIFFIYALFTKK